MVCVVPILYVPIGMKDQSIFHLSLIRIFKKGGINANFKTYSSQTVWGGSKLTPFSGSTCEKNWASFMLALTILLLNLEIISGSFSGKNIHDWLAL